MTSPIRTERHGDVLVVICDSPPVNAIGAAVRAGLEAAVRQGVADASIVAMVIRCDGRTFFAGADIAEFGKPFADPGFLQVMDTIAAADRPVVAAIHGTALGAGCELALACHYRVAAAGARLGTPEVTLGLLPGAGGTQRLPRLVGVPLALRMTALGEPITAEAAADAGLVDRIVGADTLVDEAIAFAHAMAAKRPLPRAAERTATPDPEALAAFRATHAAAFRGFDAPDANVACIEKASDGSSYADGIAFEQHAFARLMAGTQATAQRHLFFAERQAAKVEGIPAGTRPRAVVAAGALGEPPLAAALRSAGLPVVSVGAGEDPEPDLSALADCGLVIASLPESPETRARLVRRLGETCQPGAVLAIDGAGAADLDALAAAFGRPDDVVGLNLVPSAPDARLMEVARGARTAPDVLATAMALGRRIGAVTVVVAASPDLIARRLARRQLAAATALLGEGVEAERIDRAGDGFGMAAGPFATAQRLGLPVERPAGGGSRTIDDEEIVRRLLYPVVDEAASILADGHAQRASDIDLVGVHGLGWPAYRGGPLFWGAGEGWNRIVAGLESRDIAPGAGLRAEAGAGAHGIA